MIHIRIDEGDALPLIEGARFYVVYVTSIVFNYFLVQFTTMYMLYVLVILQLRACLFLNSLELLTKLTKPLEKNKTKKQ